MRHRFFDGVSFDDLSNGLIESPWQPEVTSQRDTKFFDFYPEEEEIYEGIPRELDEKFFSTFNN